MALCRCENHLPPKKKYIVSVEPLGYQQTSSICGIINCNEPGLIWLEEKEFEDFNMGQRIFYFATNSVKVKVKGVPVVGYKK